MSVICNYPPIYEYCKAQYGLLVKNGVSSYGNFKCDYLMLSGETTLTAPIKVILVDQYDNVIGSAEKMSAHIQGLCHRAFSVFIVHATPQGWMLLLQQRAWGKYHSQGLWTNTCCSHPSPDESIMVAAERRLQEEFGFSMPLQSAGVFHYSANLEDNLIENEIDHVLVGYGKPEQIKPNPEEIADYRWWSLDELQLALKHTPQQFTVWLKPALNILVKTLEKKEG